MRTLILVLLGVLCTAAVCHGRVITVDDDGPADFNNIQAAIDDANDGDTVVVQPGRYMGAGNRDIDFKGKPVTVRSLDPNDPIVVRTTIVDPNGTEEEPHCGFYFRSNELRDSTVAGLTITNGFGLKLSRGFGLFNVGGGVCVRENSCPTIRRCIISGNSAKFGGGIHSFLGKPTIAGCIISNNSGIGGIDLLGGNPSIINCTILGNRGGILWRRTGVENGEEAAVTNSIVWDNGVGEVWTEGPGLRVTHSDIGGGWIGEGNIDADPCFADPNNGDYHLKSQAGRWDTNEGRWTIDEVTSPCIDAGDPMGPIGLEPFPNGGRINMGAYGGTEEASKSYFGKPGCETIVAGDINGDCIVDLRDLCIMGLHWCEED